MTIPYMITIGNILTHEQKDAIEGIINSTFDEVNRHYNNYNPDSEVSQINRLKEYERFTLSEPMKVFLTRVGHMVELTDGYFDPSVAPAFMFWKETVSRGEVPNEERLKAVLRGVGWHHIHLDNGKLYKDHSATALDFGGIAKGYCIDLISERLRANGFTNHLIEWGGEIYCSGTHPEGRNWTIHVRHPYDADPSKALAALPLQDLALASSGSYFQFWDVVKNGNTIRYTHIMHPKKGELLSFSRNSPVACSVIAKTCLEADALATRAMIFNDRGEAGAWARQITNLNPEYIFLFVYPDDID
ncbi:MAG: FAD:protein FMN transferase [Chlamydiales bacterium]